LEAFPEYGTSRVQSHLLQKGDGSMMKANSSLAGKVIERIVELSADAHIRRRGVLTDSLEFQALSGAIAAYGKALALLTALQKREEFYAMLANTPWPPEPHEVRRGGRHLPA
jgi:hypothetical protein